jgi:hypothetical protein
MTPFSMGHSPQSGPILDIKPYLSNDRRPVYAAGGSRKPKDVPE